MIKMLLHFLNICLLVTILYGCGSNETSKLSCNDMQQVSDVQKLSEQKIGMVTDAGIIDDKSFNESTWKGIRCFEKLNGTSSKYLKPKTESTSDYLVSIQNLVDLGYKVIVTPGFKFDEAIYLAQDKFPDVNFILIDAVPKQGEQSKINDNVVSINFAEEQAGFLVGVAAALNTKTNKVGFIGGMAIPTVESFGIGFIAGVAYANNQYGLNVTIPDYLYQGTFDDVQGGQNLAAGMYDKGVDIIFHAAAAVGLGVFNEAKTRAEKGDEVYVIGVDTDQYDQGVYGDGAKSVTLTSALKRIDVATYDNIVKYVKGEFNGGQSIRMDISMNGIGIPDNNPNMSADSISKIEEIKTRMIKGEIDVPRNREQLDIFKRIYKIDVNLPK